MEIFKELDTAQFSNGWDRTGGANTVMSSSLLASHFELQTKASSADCSLQTPSQKSPI